MTARLTVLRVVRDVFITRRSSMIIPFKGGKLYFVRTVTFYYIARFVKSRDGFLEFEDAECILSIPDWEDFLQSKPRLPPAYKPLKTGKIWINKEAIVDMLPWE
jgi:hypothetical protein